MCDGTRTYQLHAQHASSIAKDDGWAEARASLQKAVAAEMDEDIFGANDHPYHKVRLA